MPTFTDPKTKKILTVSDVDTFKYGSHNQKRFAKSVNAKYILVTGDNRGRLTEWIKRILKMNNFWYKKIGCTTYKKNVFALYEVKP